MGVALRTAGQMLSKAPLKVSLSAKSHFDSDFQNQNVSPVFYDTGLKILCHKKKESERKEERSGR